MDGCKRPRAIAFSPVHLVEVMAMIVAVSVMACSVLWLEGIGQRAVYAMSKG